MFSAVLFSTFATAIPYQIGHGYDLAELSLWDFSSGATPRTVLTGAGPDIPSECYNKDSQCAMAFTKEVKSFANLHSVYNYFDSSTSFGVSGGYDGVTASIKAAFGHMSSNSWFDDSAGAIGTLMNRRACHEIADSCLESGSKEHLDPEFVANLKQMPTDVTGDNTDVLKMWVKTIIDYRGTHLCTGTDNGAAIKYISWANACGKAVANCASSKICLGLSYKNYVSIDGCFGQKGCENGTEKHIDYGSNCAAVGGSGLLTSSMCDLGCKKANQIAFLNSGNVSSTDSVIDMRFMRLDTLLERFGMNSTIVKTMGKAIDYHLCVKQAPGADVWAWERHFDLFHLSWGEPKCTCKRECANGGTLDEATCTCKCRGDVNHGWMGPTCKETYGMCQPGEGTGNAAAATRCAVNNFCENSFDKEYCGPTGVCCLTDFHSKCCPFGSYCNCNAELCECEYPDKAAEVTAALSAASRARAALAERFDRLLK